MVITLTPDIEAALAEQARQQGTTPEVLALDCLRERFVPHPPNNSIEEQGTLAEYLADHLGVLSSSEGVPGGGQLSKDAGKKFTEGLLKKRQQGKL